ncbi:MAG: GNAT family acetyltransferase [Rhizobiales bacterium]|nr:GNAT family acetyltransferase [Hyphomicrobiales bacterium]
MSALASASEHDIPKIIDLWTRAGLVRPWNDPDLDITFALKSPNADILIWRDEDAISASVMVGHDGHRGVVYYLAVDPDQQGNGIGAKIMKAAENWLIGQGIWKLNLMIRSDNQAVQKFYQAIGYETEDRIVMSRRLKASDT